ncbi:uncharacterized protein LOC105426917 [Pogonomyrmex barbatus]|uniref:Uncharacterized protein LOC105426917 n=1 Tax=Pogonomyrmex barbatus TaxID=144034 RepID=A0A8N1S7M1_9HYME|nr:uncharacterized protein LOC105426917 [Pogonomyrmex barbatus]
MEHRSIFRFVLALIAMIEVTSAPTSDFGLGRTVWQNVGKHSFYGPWDILVKRNGDYIDYNDYGVHPEQFRPNSELPYDDVSISNGYIDGMPSTYDSSLSELNTLLSSVDLA